MYYLAILHLIIYLTKMKTYVHTKPFAQIFIAAFFAIAKNGK